AQKLPLAAEAGPFPKRGRCRSHQPLCSGQFSARFQHGPIPLSSLLSHDKDVHPSLGETTPDHFERSSKALLLCGGRCWGAEYDLHQAHGRGAPWPRGRCQIWWNKDGRGYRSERTCGKCRRSAVTSVPATFTHCAADSYCSVQFHWRYRPYLACHSRAAQEIS